LNGASCTLTEVDPTAYYLVGGLDGEDWAVSATPMADLGGGSYSVDLEKVSTAAKVYRFAIAPNTVIDGGAVFNWKRIYRPKTGDTSDFWLNFINYADQDITTDDAQGNAWRVLTTMRNCDWTIIFVPGSSKWSSTTSFDLTIANNNTAEKSYATFSFPGAVKVPTGVRAFYCTGTTGATANLTKFTTGIAANDGALLAAAAGDYTFEPADDTPSAIAGNLLKPTDGNNIYDSGKFRYVFAKQGGALGFYKLTADYEAPEFKAYLETDSELESRLAFNFDDEQGDVTGIESVKVQNTANQEFFNLAGQRVAQPTRGLYIVNGKKFVIK